MKADEVFNNAAGLLSYKDLDGLVSMSLFGRAGGCFIGAVRLSCSGQTTEAWALLRACLENSLYAFYIANNPDLANVWFDRHKSEAHKKKCKKLFVIGTMLKALEAESRSIAKEAKRLYDTSIDWGAHPNERSLTPNLVKKQDGSGFELRTLNPDENLMRASICTILWTVSTVFRIFGLAFPDEFKHRNLAVKIENLNKQLKLTDFRPRGVFPGGE